jgi:hypothetical protein
MSRRLLVLTTALLALSAPSASAATICVYPGSGCDESWLSLQDAVNSAAVNPAARDTIKINPGPDVVGAVDVGPSNLVDIIGAGRGPGGTVLRSSSSDYALDVQSPGSTVSNLRVTVGPQVGGEGGLALSGAGATADAITVIGESGIAQATGVEVRTSAILRNSLVELPSTGNANYAVRAEDNTLIDNVSAAGDAMVRGIEAGPPVVVRRLRSSNRSRIGVSAGGAGSITISDSLIRISGGTSGAGLMAETNSGGGPSVVARHVTIVGTSDPTAAGVGASAGGFNAGRTATVDVRDSIFHGLSTDLEVEGLAGGAARILIDHSNYDPTKVADTTVGDAQVVPGASNVLANPGFVDGAADFRLRSDSALIDRGFPGEGSTADLDGQARPNDGNGDGVAVRDIGAFEFQRPSAPPPTADTSAPLFRIVSKGLRLDRRGRVAVVLRGPANETAASSGSVRMRSVRRLRASAAPRARRIALGRKTFSLMPSARSVVRVKLSRRNVRRVRALRRLRVVLAVTARDAAGNSRTARKTVSLRAARTPR